MFHHATSLALAIHHSWYARRSCAISFPLRGGIYINPSHVGHRPLQTTHFLAEISCSASESQPKDMLGVLFFTPSLREKIKGLIILPNIRSHAETLDHLMEILPVKVYDAKPINPIPFAEQRSLCLPTLPNGMDLYCQFRPFCRAFISLLPLPTKMA